MKRLTLSVIATIAIGTFAVAGGDIAPVEPVIDTPVVTTVAGSGLYLGGAYGAMGLDYSAGSVFGFDTSHDAFMLQAGYKFNPYIAVEGRYWLGSSDDLTFGGMNYSVDLEAWGLYVKPMYPVTPELDIYALLGYGDTSPEIEGVSPDYDTDGLQWGLGLSYDVNNNVALFVDYVMLYDDTNDGEDMTIDTWNVGVSYKF